MISGFEFVKEEFRKGEYPKELPHRATAQSAGYDFYSPKDILLHPGERVEMRKLGLANPLPVEKPPSPGG